MGMFNRVSRQLNFTDFNPIFHGIILKTIEGKQVKLTNLIKKSNILLKVLRRVGCPITRYECKLLSELKPYFDIIGVKLVAVTFEEIECHKFYVEGYWQGDLLIDKNKTLYNVLRLYNQSEKDTLADMFSYSGILAKRLALGSKVKSRNGGDPFQLGGTFVIEKDGSIVYEFRQRVASVFPSIKEIYSAAGGDPDLVEEILPKECIYHLNSSNENLKCNQWMFSFKSSGIGLDAPTVLPINTKTNSKYKL